MKNMPDDILELLLNLCSIPSVTGIPGAEDDVPKFIYDKLRHWPYFQKHPKDIWLEPLLNDHLKRHNFCALVRAEPAVKRTVVLISHHDVVATDVCGNLSTIAFHPVEFCSSLSEMQLGDEAKADLNSKNWLFGRGVSDMKSGMAIQIGFLAEAADFYDNLKANILLMTLADEENNGFGVHQAIRMLSRLQAQEGLEYIACIDSEPTISNDKKEHGLIYTGSIGNATLLALCVGKESHVGEYFEGVNATFIASHLVQEIEGDPESSDEWQGKRYSPMTCLKMRDMQRGYSVTLPERVAVVFNALTVTHTPEHLIGYVRRAAEKALGKALAQLDSRRETFKKNGYPLLQKVSCVPHVITYGELINELKKHTDRSILEIQKEFLDRQDPQMDSQDRGIELLNHMADLAALKGPLAIIGLLSPYCQPRVNRRSTKQELAAMDAVETVISYAKENFNKVVTQAEVYEGISDMSEMGFQGDVKEIETLAENLIGYGIDLNHPFKEMQALDIPVINLGPIGKDAHKLTERVNLDFLLDVLPSLMKKLIYTIIDNDVKGKK